MEYTTAYKEQIIGDYGGFGIEINIAAGRELTPDERRKISLMAKEIKETIMIRTIERDPKAIAEAEEQREGLMAGFPPYSCVDEIPNEYCKDYCCTHLPWFIVKTEIGRIKIGWRKRVIMIDWSDTQVSECGEQLFHEEATTKGQPYDNNGMWVHADGYDKAKEYIGVLLSTSTVGCGGKV